MKHYINWQECKKHEEKPPRLTIEGKMYNDPTDTVRDPYCKHCDKYLGMMKEFDFNIPDKYTVNMRK